MARKKERKISWMPITQAQVNLGAVVRRIHLNKESVILEKGGIPVAGLMDADELEDYLKIHDPKVQARFETVPRKIWQARTLRGHQGLLWLRVGAYCVIYQVRDEALLVIVVRIGYRRNVYRNL